MSITGSVLVSGEDPYKDQFMTVAESVMKWLHELEQKGGFDYARLVVY